MLSATAINGFNFLIGLFPAYFFDYSNCFVECFIALNAWAQIVANVRRMNMGSFIIFGNKKVRLDKFF